MKKVTLLLAFTVSCFITDAQVPKGFNYQAIARNTSGDPIVNTAIPVRLTIQSDSLGGTIYWQELHSAVTTNDLGLFTLVVGKGARQPASTVATFPDVDWTVTPKFIKTEVDYSGWKNMGSSRLWTVPYSMVAGDISGDLRKLTVTGETSNMEEALFEVRNKLGQTVFAVYNEGVRIYVDDGDAKGLKGGFAIGGLNPAKGGPQDLFIVSPDSIRAYIYDNPLTKPLKGGFAIGGFDYAKGITNDYLLVSPDSIRAYIDSGTGKGLKGGFAIGGLNPAKAAPEEYLRVSRDSTRIYINDLPGKPLKGGFAIGGFDNAKGGNASFFDVATEATGIINPSQNRILWYPLKNALLAGKVRVGTPDSVGTNSFASGFESKSRGVYSQALGYKAIANGDYSTAIGKNAVANKNNSFSFGDNVLASALNSYAFGKNSTASGDGSYSFGYNAIASGQDSYAFGTGAEAQGVGSVAMGFIGRDSAGFATGNTLATYDYTIAIGMGAQATAKGAFAIGVIAKATNEFGIAIGYKTEAKGNYGSLAMGYKTIASGEYSTSIGNWSTASSVGSTAIGSYSVASGENSAAIGGWNIASGNSSTALGGWTQATGFNSTSMGYQTIANGQYSTAIGLNSVAKGFNGTAMGWGTVASGYFTTATGYNTTANVRNSFVIGRYNDTTCSVNGSSTWVTTDPLFICGNGSSNTNRSNALTIFKNGNAYIQGNLGIGTTTPGSKLTITGLTGTTSGAYLRIFNDDVYYYSSSVKTKTDIEPLSEDFHKILNAQPVSFTDKVSGERNIGFIAEDFDSLGLNNLVIYENGAPLSLSYELISLYNLEIIKEQQKAIKEQQDQIESYKSENDNLKSLLETLQGKVEQIEAMLGNKCKNQRP